MYENTPISVRRLMLIGLLCFLLSTILLVYRYITNSYARVVFCDVGQGDGAYIRTITGIDIIIDAGPNKSMLRCLGQNMPIFDKSIEYAFLSHPHIDHYGGFQEVAQNYRINNLYVASDTSTARSYTHFKQALSNTGTEFHIIMAPQQIDVDAYTKIDIMWPYEEFTSSDVNEYSLVMLLSFAHKRILFTGDVSPFVLSLLQELHTNLLQSVDVLKVPHHGSQNGLTYEFLKLADPVVSVISVGKHNRFNHPSKKTIDYFKALNKLFYLTSDRGDITITTYEDVLSVVGQDGLDKRLQIPQ